MSRDSAGKGPERVNANLLTSGGILNLVWGRRAFWQVRLRWFMTPLMLAAMYVGRRLGYEFSMRPIFFIAIFILLYNIVFAVLISRMRHEPELESRRDRLYSIAEVSLDYASMFALIFYTGGPASPLSFFLIFHVIFAAIHFRPSTAYLFAGAATGGMWFLTLAEFQGWLQSVPLGYAGKTLTLSSHPGHIVAMMGFFMASVMIVAIASTRIMRSLRKRVQSLSESTRRIAALNEELHSIYSMLMAIGDERKLEPVLEVVTRGMADTIGVKMTAVKLLDEQAGTVTFKGGHGLPEELIGSSVKLVDSPMNQKIIGGKTLVLCDLEDDPEEFQCKQRWLDKGIRSIIFAPLLIEMRVIGVLSAYSTVPNYFCRQDESYFVNMVAELAALAIDNTRAYQEVRDVMDERSQFTLQVAHNMRSPIGATLSMLELISAGYMGEVNPKQLEYLNRVERRLRALNSSVGELLTLAQTRDQSREIVEVDVDLGALLRHLQTTYREEAQAKDLTLIWDVEEELPSFLSSADLLQQTLENLISNAIKYTPGGGRVELSMRKTEQNQLHIMVQDTGIGIPAAEQGKLFQEFFRASNARRLKEVGTGLGLALVRQAVLRHGGDIFVTSEENSGTCFSINLPFRPRRQI